MDPQDLYSAEVIADPAAYYSTLMREDPVHWDEQHATWIVTRYADVVWLVRHPELFSSSFYLRDSARPASPPIDPADVAHAEYVVQFRAREFIQNDPPEHGRMRNPFKTYFNPKQMERWRGLVRDCVAAILDPLLAAGSMDLRTDVGDVLPLMVICELLGIPEQDRGLLMEQAQRRMRSALSLAPDRMRVAASGIAESQDYLAELLTDRQAAGDPAELMAILIDAEAGGTYTRDEALANGLSLLDAGFETTTQLVCNGMLALLRHPEQWARLVADPEALAAPATEECLRYDPPLPALRRIAAVDVELGGKTIRAGDRVLYVITSANRDPSVFPDPEAFDIGRSPNRHVAFGSGIHVCLGQYLARMEGQEVFAALAHRIPEVRLTDSRVRYADLRGVHSVESLPLQWAAPTALSS